MLFLRSARDSALDATAIGRAVRLSAGTHERYVLTAEIKRQKGAGALVADSLSAERVDFWKKTLRESKAPESVRQSALRKEKTSSERLRVAY